MKILPRLSASFDRCFQCTFAALSSLIATATLFAQAVAPAPSPAAAATRTADAAIHSSVGGTRLELRLPTATRITSVVLKEAIAHGERIQNYVASGRRPDGQWLEIARGRSVGHKRIEQFAALEVTARRLTVDQAKAEPRLRQFAACAGA